MKVSGTFTVTTHGEPPFDDIGSVTMARARVDKCYEGALEAMSQVYMLAARTPIANSAAYVGLERIEGMIDQRTGSFLVVHLGVRNRGEDRLTIDIVPDSGTGELAGIAGSMTLRIVDGQHRYELDYELPALGATASTVASTG